MDSSAPASSALTPCGSPATTSGGWRTPAPPSRTTRGATCASAAASPPVREMLDAGVAVGLGTDGSVCADNQNLFEALRIASVVSTVRFPHATDRWLDARTVWSLATTGGARVLGLAADLGAVAPGRKADLVMLRADSIFLRPLADPLNALVYAETARAWTRCWSTAGSCSRAVTSPAWTRRGSMRVRRPPRTRSAPGARRRGRSRSGSRPTWPRPCRAAVATPFPVKPLRGVLEPLEGGRGALHLQPQVGHEDEIRVGAEGHEPIAVERDQRRPAVGPQARPRSWRSRGRPRTATDRRART